MKGGKILILLLLLVVMPTSYAININPQQYSIDDPKKGENYNIVLTIINPDVSTYNIDANIATESDYLEPYVDLEKENIELGPNDRENLGFKFNIPENISVGNHELVIDFLTHHQKLASFTLDFEIEGEKKREIVFKEVHTNAKDTETPVYFTLEAENKGNVIEYIKPVIEVSKDEEIIKTIDKAGSFRVMPGEQNNFSLMFDPARIKEGGTYNFVSYLKYNNQATEEIEGNFNIDIIERDKDGKLKRIKHGENLEIPVNVKRTADDFSFYKIKAKIPKENISRTIEGSFEEENKFLNISLETKDLPPGKYKMELEIAEGRQLENVRKEEYTIRIQEGFFMQALPLIFILVIVSLVLWVYLSGPPAVLCKFILNKKIKKVSNGLNEIEKDMKELNRELNEFITSSNEWLSQYGKGFK